MFLQAGEPLHYLLRYWGGPTAHIEIAIPGAPAAHTLVMPRAVPMGYAEQPYDRFVSNVHGWTTKNTAVRVTRDDGPRWRIEEGASTVEYDVDVQKMEREILQASDSSRVRPVYAGFLGYSVFAFIEGLEERPIILDIQTPGGWPAFSTLAPTEGPIRAANFYALADSQIAMGNRLTIQRVSAGGFLVSIFLYAEVEAGVDRSRIGSLVATAMERMIAYYGPPPFSQYTVHIEVLEPVSAQHRYGFSMEHMDSSSYYLSKNDPISLFNFAHHIGHSWLPKRCYGEGYFPFSWEFAPVLDTIWFAEGFGQYAAIVAISDSEEQRQQLIESRFRRNLAVMPESIRRMGLIELSRIASTRYAEDFRTGRSVFSRGGLMAAEMDDRIRQRTGGAKSLRDALRYLIAWTAREQRAFHIEELPVLIRVATGVDTADILEKWLKPL